MLWHTQCTCMYPSTHKVKQVSETFVPERPTLSLSGPLPFPVWSRILSVYEGKGLCFRSPEWMSVSEETVLFTTWIHWPAFVNHHSGRGGGRMKQESEDQLGESSLELAEVSWSVLCSQTLCIWPMNPCPVSFHLRPLRGHLTCRVCLEPLRLVGNAAQLMEARRRMTSRGTKRDWIDCFVWRTNLLNRRVAGSRLKRYSRQKEWPVS